MNLSLLRRWQQLLVATSLLAGPAIAQQEAAAASLFSAFEKQLWQLVAEPHQLTPQQVWQQLQALQQDPSAQQPAQRALLLFQLCRHAIRNQLNDELPLVLQQFSALEQSPLYRRGASARFKCQQLQSLQQDQPAQAFEQSYQAYHQLQPADSPALKVWIAYDYANDALEAGAYDESVAAIRQSLQIAQHNQLTEWEGESLGVLALIQSEMKLYDEALQNNQQALRLVQTPSNIQNLTSNRGYILTQAKHLPAALALYQQQMQQSEHNNIKTYLIAGTNVSGIYVELGKSAENLQLTAHLKTVADQSGDDFLQAYVNVARAVAILADGQYSSASTLFQQGRHWFEENKVSGPFSGSLESWAEALFRAGYPADAYQALRDSLQYRKATDESRRKDNALLANAALAAEQKNRALLQLQQERERDQAILRQQQLLQYLWLTAAVSVALLSSVLLLSHRRLRQAHRLLAEKNRQLDHESSHDPLTKVHNRRYFQQFIQHKLSAGQPALLLLMDIDHFKKVNDTYGHHAGDLVLQAVSQRLAGRLRDCDRIIRWGGEEFLIYIDQPADEQNCQALVQRLLAEVEKTPVPVGDTAIRITISIGFAFVRLSSQNELEQQLGRIDELLYQAKHQGRNQAVGMLSSDMPLQLRPA